MKKKVLFVCVHNSARSQMAEALLLKYGEDKFDAYSAGIEAGQLNPYVVRVLQEDEGIDISNNQTKSAFDLYTQGKLFNYVVTVCDYESSQKCPIFPGVRARIIMSFEDPRSFTGSDEEIMDRVREVKEKIKAEILRFIDLVNNNQIKENFPEHWKLG